MRWDIGAPVGDFSAARVRQDSRRLQAESKLGFRRVGHTGAGMCVVCESNYTQRGPGRACTGGAWSNFKLLPLKRSW